MKLFCLTAVLLLTCRACQDVANIWPIPKSVNCFGESTSIHSALTIKASNVESDRLNRGVQRYQQHFDVITAKHGTKAGLKLVYVDVLDWSDALNMRTDMSYSVVVNDNQALINATTIYGAMYGLESLLQMSRDGSLPGSSITIEDVPNYSWRSLMIDTGRRFFPMDLVKNLLDTMAAVKLNVLHLHASDLCRFSVESKRFPNLTAALTGLHAGHYTQDDIATMISYAKDRGIRVVPEFDVPGHSHGLQPLLSQGLQFCSDDSTSQSQLYNDPKNQTLNLITEVMAEMATLFEDEVFDIGCDETSVKGPCSLESTFAFERTLLNTIQHDFGKTPAGWEEVYFDAQAATPSTIVSAWSRHNPAEITATGRQAIEASSAHFYFTSAAPGGPDGWSKCWYDIATGVPANETHLLLGGSISMWSDEYCYISECINPNSIPPGAKLFDPKFDAEFGQSIGGMIWPRGFVAAAAYWNYNASVDPAADAFVQQIYTLNDQLQERGALVCPSNCSCDYLTACGKPYIKPTPSSVGSTFTVKPCDTSQLVNQQFVMDHAATRLRLASNTSLCLNYTGDKTYPVTLALCEASTTAFSHDPATGHLVYQGTGACLDIQASTAEVGTWKCGANQSNQAWAYDSDTQLLVDVSRDGSLPSDHEGQCLTVVPKAFD
eukprot:TRINITY_DN7621_c0_g1_i4.p1 TRINITY_DN7621_c0_g1~~TRINITY_DN7621_c0_g1_i4.p1  ORF type:complete len:662 (+),score=154.23 TRINITY_DN7621_c0_g1_i4:21-2006(+)